MMKKKNVACCMKPKHATCNMQHHYPLPTTHHPIKIILLTILLLTACTQPPTASRQPPAATIYADGLLNPVGLTHHNGHLIVAEEGTGEPDNSAGVTLITPDGEIGRLISGLPSGRDSGDLSGVPFAAVSPDGQTLYTSHFNAGKLLTLDISDGLALSDIPHTPTDLGETMTPLNAVQLINPFDITFNPDGTPIVSDASNNGVAIPTADGRTRFFHRFDPLTNTGQGKPTIDPVPTGITRVGEEYYVTLTGGCPYPENSGQLVAIDQNRNQRTLATNLNMPIDVAVTPDGTILILEFSIFDPEGSCFSGGGYQPNTGRLSRLNPDGTITPLLTQLNFPGSLTLGNDQSLYISEIFTGRILHLQNILTLQSPISIQDLLTNQTPLLSQSPNLPISEPTPHSPPPTTHPAPAPPTTPTFTFTNVAPDIGLDFQHAAFTTHISDDPIAMMGAGLCWIDYNSDGWLDLYVVNSHSEEEIDYWQENGGLPTNKLYRNDQGQFVDITQESNAALALRGNGCIAADLNNDTHPDLFITADGPNALLWNNGDGTFTEGAATAGLAAPEWNTAASAGDLNGDGHLDLFVAAYIDLDNKIPNPSGAFPQDFYGLPDHLYVNNGDGTFTDVADTIGLQHAERGLGSVFTDLDQDGDLDLYIANDGHPNRLYVNLSTNNRWGFQLLDITQNAAVGDSGSGMGLSSADYDGDGQFDLFVTNWEAELNGLYRNNIAESGQLDFSYSTYRIGMTGLGNGMTGWGTAWADFDHDTDNDLLIVNGRVPVSDFTTDPELVRLYGNRLAEGLPRSFREWTDFVGLGQDDLGPLLARGSAVADYDNDGDLDVAINAIGGRLTLLQAENVSGNWLTVDLGGHYPGAHVRLELPDGRILIREQQIGSSYLASEDPRLHFGLGSVETVDKLWIDWGNNRGLLLEKLPTNQHLTVDISDSQPVAWRGRSAAQYSQTQTTQPVDNPVDSVDNLTTNSLPHAWFDLQRKIAEETPGFAPPVVARAFGYTGLVLYESLAYSSASHQSLVGQIDGLNALPQPDPVLTYHWPIVANSALAYMTDKMYPNMSGKNIALVQQLEADYNDAFAVDNAVLANSASYGRELAQALYVYSLADGGDGAHRRNFPQDYPLPTGPGMWEPTPPTFTSALLPYWQFNRPFVLTEAGACDPGPPVPYSEEPDSDFYAEAYIVYETVLTLTDEQRDIALFWADDPGDTSTPPGHSISILTQILRQENATLLESAESYARMGLALNDAFISVWYTKYKYNLIRPITYIQRIIDPNWNTPVVTDPVTTPPFPEYTSGHSVQAGAAAGVLTHLFGDPYAFTDATHVERGLPARSFTSFDEMAQETADSRLYGGIHYPMSNSRGVDEGQCVANHINQLTFQSE